MHVVVTGDGDADYSLKLGSEWRLSYCDRKSMQEAVNSLSDLFGTEMIKYAIWNI